MTEFESLASGEQPSSRLVRASQYVAGIFREARRQAWEADQLLKSGDFNQNQNGLTTSLAPDAIPLHDDTIPSHE